MKEIIADKNLLAYCGLYCGACPRYLKEKCPGCHKYEKATWCKIRSCCIENHYQNCTVCKEYNDVHSCKKYNNFMSRVFGFIFRTDRSACIDYIKKHGDDTFINKMTAEKRMAFRR